MDDLLAHVTKPADGSLRIVSLLAENVKRLQAVEIKPDGNLVEITGRNGQGKTSILDAIWWAMKGRGVVQSTPIRRGCEEARIVLNLGPITVRRTFKPVKDGPGFTTEIKVEAADGARYPAPQTLLDGLMGELSIDPLAFMRMKPAEQFDILRGFVRGFDFAANARERQAAFDRRTDVNRDARRARAAAHEIVVPSELPDDLIDEAALTEELARAGEHNGSIEARKERRAQAVERIARYRADADAQEAGLPGVIARIEADRDETVAGLEAEIVRLRQRIDEKRHHAAAQIEQQRAGIAADVAQARAEADALQAKLDEAGPLPEPIDVADLQQRIAKARDANAGIRQRNLRDRQIENAERLEAEAEQLTAAIAAADKAKADAIAAAELPIPGVEFGDGVLLLNGVPLDQASDAEQLRVSVAIAMAMHPRLRVIRVRDGNVLDADGMKLLADLAAAHDCQVWVETVRPDDRVAFVIEDGRVRRPETAEAA